MRLFLQKYISVRKTVIDMALPVLTQEGFLVLIGLLCTSGAMATHIGVKRVVHSTHFLSPKYDQ